MPSAFLRNAMSASASHVSSGNSMTSIGCPREIRAMTYLETGSRTLSNLQQSSRQGVKELSWRVFSAGNMFPGALSPLVGRSIGAEIAQRKLFSRNSIDRREARHECGQSWNLMDYASGSERKKCHFGEAREGKFSQQNAKCAAWKYVRSE